MFTVLPMKLVFEWSCILLSDTSTVLMTPFWAYLALYILCRFGSILLILFYLSHRIFINVIYMLGIFHIFFHFDNIKYQPFRFLSKETGYIYICTLAFRQLLQSFSQHSELPSLLISSASFLATSKWVFLSPTFILCFHKMWCHLKTTPHILLFILKLHMIFCESSGTTSVIFVCWWNSFLCCFCWVKEQKPQFGQMIHLPKSKYI